MLSRNLLSRNPLQHFQTIATYRSVSSLKFGSLLCTSLNCRTITFIPKSNITSKTTNQNTIVFSTSKLCFYGCNKLWQVINCTENDSHTLSTVKTELLIVSFTLKWDDNNISNMWREYSMHWTTHSSIQSKRLICNDRYANYCKSYHKNGINICTASHKWLINATHRRTWSPSQRIVATVRKCLNSCWASFDWLENYTNEVEVSSYILCGIPSHKTIAAEYSETSHISRVVE